MKNHISLALISFILSLPSFSQSDEFVEKKSRSLIQKGTFYIGGNSELNINRSTIKRINDSYKVSFLNTNISPTLGYFIGNNFLIGVQFNHFLNKSIVDREYQINDPNDRNNLINIESTFTEKYRENLFSLFARYYLGREKLKPFIGFGGGLGYSLFSNERDVNSLNSLYSSNFETERKQKITVIKGELGLTYFLSNHFALDGSISLISIENIDFNERRNTYSANIGLSIFLGQNQLSNNKGPASELSNFKLNPGTFYLGSSSNIGGQRLAIDDNRTFTGFNFSQSAGVFVAKNLLFGLDFEYNYLKDRQEINFGTINTFTDLNNYEGFISLLAKYFIGNNRLKPFLSLEAGAGISKNEDLFPDINGVPTINTSLKEILRAEGSVGLSYFINSRMSIDGSLSYGNTAPENERAEFYYNGNLGISLYLGKNRISNQNN